MATTMEKMEKIDKKELNFWLSRFYNELQNKIHVSTSVKRCFRPGITKRLVPDSFSFVFWKPAYLFENEAWTLADKIMPALYALGTGPSPRFFIRETQVLNCLLNYIVWKGRFSWLYNLADIFYKQSAFHLDLFQYTVLSLAYNRNFSLAEFYYKQIAAPSAYFYLGYQNLSTKKLSAKNCFDKHFDLSYTLLKSCHTENDVLYKEAIRSLSRLPITTNALLEQYSVLLSLGLLFRATRLILVYIKKRSAKDYLLKIVLESYLWNDKFYLYLKRLLVAKTWPGKEAWYEAEYCMRRLNLQSEGALIWDRIFANKKKSSIVPSPIERSQFKDLSHQAMQNKPILPENLPQDYQSIALNLYVSVLISENNLLKRRYKLYEYYIKNPLLNGWDIDPMSIVVYGASLFWTFSLYLSSMMTMTTTVRHGLFFNTLESLAGRSFAARALLGIHNYRNGSRALSFRLLNSTSYHHPMLKTLQLQLLIERGDLVRSQKIASGLAKRYPKDSVIHANNEYISQL